MKDFNFSHKSSMMILKVVSLCIVFFTVVCVLLDKDEAEEETGTLKSIAISSNEIVKFESTTKKLLLKQNELIGDMKNNLTGILGVVKGTLEVSPSISPPFKPGWRKPKLPQSARKDTLTIENKVNTTDSIFITIGVDGDTIRATTGNDGSGKGCCCCKCCCKNCHKEGCR